MTEPSTIPATMLEAATKAVLKVRGCSDQYIEEVQAGEYPGWEVGVRYAQSALEAADVPALLARIAELEAALGVLLDVTEQLSGIPGTSTYNPAFVRARKLLLKAQSGAGGE